MAKKNVKPVAKTSDKIKKNAIKRSEVKTLNPKGKTMGEIAKEVAKNKNPKTVKVVEGDSLKKLRKNVESYYSTVKAKSGATAKEKAVEIRKANAAARAAGKTPVIRIRGGAGMGGMFNTKNR